MTSHSSSRKKSYGTARLCQDIATLINDRQCSDVQFKIGGGVPTQGSGETIYDESKTVTLYAHSPILRCRSTYFASILEKDRDFKERSKCVIYKPNISPATFQDVLHYIYTGDVHAKSSENIIELITVANEMGLEELSAECQSEFVRTVKAVFSGEDQGLTKQRIPVDAAIRTHIIPALNLASSHSLSYLSQELFTFMLPHMSVIIKSPDAYTSFVNGISSEVLIKIIASDDLALTEHNVWDLSLSWACHQMKLSKTAVEARLSSLDDDEKDGEESSDGTIINSTQLNDLKKILAPLLPSIRFSLLDPEDYKHMADILIHFLSRRRFLELNRIFCDSDVTKPFDAPRAGSFERKVSSKILVKSIAWNLLRKSIFQTGGIIGCHSLNDLKFDILFRASEHGFLASTFHQRCDHKGPTLVIIRSADGHLFGGVNFNHWKSDSTFSSSNLNILFALPDGRHRKNWAMFKIVDGTKASYNHPQMGPCFGGSDLVIAHSANTNQTSYSNLPYSYNGDGALNTALAGFPSFAVSDYEVFSISKDHHVSS